VIKISTQKFINFSIVENTSLVYTFPNMQEFLFLEKSPTFLNSQFSKIWKSVSPFLKFEFGILSKLPTFPTLNLRKKLKNSFGFWRLKKIKLDNGPNTQILIFNTQILRKKKKEKRKKSIYRDKTPTHLSKKRNSLFGKVSPSYMYIPSRKNEKK